MAEAASNGADVQRSPLSAKRPTTHTNTLSLSACSLLIYCPNSPSRRFIVEGYFLFVRVCSCGQRAEEDDHHRSHLVLPLAGSGGSERRKTFYCHWWYLPLSDMLNLQSSYKLPSLTVSVNTAGFIFNRIKSIS